MWLLKIKVKDVWKDNQFRLQQDIDDCEIDPHTDEIRFVLETDINANDTVALNSDENVISYECIEITSED